MRQSLALFLARLALLALTLGMTAHVLAGTVLDPARPGRVVAAVLDSEQGRDQVAAALSAAVPPASRPAARAAVRAQLDSPPVRSAVIAAASRRTGGAALDQSAIKGPVVDALRQTSPALAKKVAAAPAAPLTAPATVLAQVQRGHDLAVHARGVLWSAAALLGVVAVAAARRRPFVLRRLGRGTLWCCAGVLATFWVLPHLLGQYTGPGAAAGQVLATGLSAAGLGLLGPVLPLAVVGVAALVAAGAGSVLSPLSRQGHLSRRERRELEQLRRRRPQPPAVPAENATLQQQSPWGP